MNIYTLPGKKVTCSSHTAGEEEEQEVVKYLLTVGAVYTVERTEVHSWHTDLYLVEFPGQRFNSVFFKNLDLQTPLEDESHPDYKNHHPAKLITKPKTINRTNVAEHLLEYQLRMVGKELIDIIDDDRWYFNWTMTRAQHEEFKKYALGVLQKVFKFNKKKAEDTFSWFDLQFGLRVKG